MSIDDLFERKEKQNRKENYCFSISFVVVGWLILARPLLNAHEVVAVKEENIMKRNYLLVIPVHL